MNLNEMDDFCEYANTQTFDPYMLPAKESLAMNHRNAQRFGLIKPIEESEYQKNICLCCLQPINTKQIKLNIFSLKEIGKVSRRMKEYFKILLFLFIIFIIIFIFSSVPNYTYNPNLMNCFLKTCVNISNETSKEIFFMEINSSFNHIGIQIFLLGTLIIVFILKYIFIYHLSKQHRDDTSDKHYIKKYSLYVQNLKYEDIDKIKEEIVTNCHDRDLKFIKKNPILDNIKIEDIVEVSPIYDVRDIHQLINSFAYHIKKIKILKLKNKINGNRNSLKNKEKITKWKKKLKQLKDKIKTRKTKKYLNEAIVTFQNSLIPQELVTNNVKKFFLRYFSNKHIYEMALEPNDYIWSNFKDSAWMRLIKGFISYVVSLGIIAGILLILSKFYGCCLSQEMVIEF